MQKNIASQKWVVFAFDITDGSAKTGDAAQITAEISKDGAAGGGNITDTNPTELEDGYYVFDITQDECNADMLLILPESSTGSIQVIGVPGTIYTTEANRNKLSVDSNGRVDVIKVAGTTQTANDNGADLAILTGSDGATLATAQGNYAPAKAGDTMALSDDAITAAKFDESTAFPVKSADAGSTQIARVGADSDTLETLSDQLDAVGGGGVGDYEVTITIRTTSGTPIAGISIWLNSSNDRSVSVAGTKVTDTNGQVTFNLEYTTYYIFCHLSGYTFASASFTVSAGNVTFVKDIAAATSAGSSAFYGDSFLSRAIDKVRESTDEPTQAAKYTDTMIIQHLEEAYILVLNEKNRNSRTPAVAKITKTIVSGTTTYVLPHTIGSIHGIYKLGDAGGKVFYDSRSKYNVFGRGMWLENQTLHIQTDSMYGLGTEITIEYIPSGIARLHNGVCTLNAAGTIVTFGATPNAGVLDTHHEAYAGCVLRILGVDGTTVVGNYLQERVITAYDETTREATLDVPLSPIPTTDDGNIYYEIAPTISKGMDLVVALYAAYNLVGIEGNTKRSNNILKAYGNAIRNVRLTAYYSLMPDSVIDRADSHDNRRFMRR